jgi:hypothetical protein
MLGGTAQQVENLAAVDLSGSDTDYRKRDDTPQALSKIEQLLASIEGKLSAP